MASWPPNHFTQVFKLPLIFFFGRFFAFFFTSQVLINNHNYLWQLYWQQALPSYPMRSLLASQVRQLSRTGRIYPLYVPRYLPLKKTARLSSFSIYDYVTSKPVNLHTMLHVMANLPWVTKYFNNDNSFFLTIVFFAEWICWLFFDTIGRFDKQQTILFMIDDVKAAKTRHSSCIICVKPFKFPLFMSNIKISCANRMSDDTCWSFM